MDYFGQLLMEGPKTVKFEQKPEYYEVESLSDTCGKSFQGM